MRLLKTNMVYGTRKKFSSIEEENVQLKSQVDH